MLERYSPDQYGRMAPDPQGDWLLFPSVQVAMMDALEANGKAHQATISDLQGQVKDYQACRDALDRTVLELTQAKQRVAQLERGVEEQKRNYLSACETIYKMYVAATGREGVAPKRGVVEDLADLQADHAAMLGLVQALPVAKHLEIQHEVDEHGFEEWRVRLNGNPFADCETVEDANALKAILEYRASLPAQPAQGGA